jgi:hypothetical protein
MTKFYAPAAPTVRNFATKPQAVRPTKIRNVQRKPYRSVPPATDELLHRPESQAADNSLNFARYRSRHVAITWRSWNGKSWKLEEVTRQYSEHVSRVQHAEESFRAVEQRKFKQTQGTESTLHKFLTQYHGAVVNLFRTVEPMKRLFLDNNLIHYLIDGFALDHPRHTTTGLKMWLADTRQSMHTELHEVVSLSRLRGQLLMLSYDPANFLYESAYRRLKNENGKVKSEVRGHQRATRWSMKLENGRRGHLDQAKLWSNERHRHTEAEKRLLRRSLDERMCTLWNSYPRVWAVEGFVAAALSHKKKTVMLHNIIRSDVQTFHHQITRIANSKRRYIRRNKIWAFIIIALAHTERILVDMGDLVADYRALVLFRTNISTPSTLRPQIEMGRAIYSRMQTWFSTPGSKNSRTGAAHSESHEDTGRTFTGSTREQLPQIDGKYVRHETSRVWIRTQPKNTAHLLSTSMRGGIRGKHDAEYNTLKTNWRPREEHTRYSNENKDLRSTGVSDHILSVLRAAQFRP